MRFATTTTTPMRELVYLYLSFARESPTGGAPMSRTDRLVRTGNISSRLAAQYHTRRLCLLSDGAAAAAAAAAALTWSPVKVMAKQQQLFSARQHPITHTDLEGDAL